MKKILLTGTDGFLGKEVFNVLLNENYNLLGISRRRKQKNIINCDLSSNRKRMESKRKH